jgi:hypothetical protein
MYLGSLSGGGNILWFTGDLGFMSNPNSIPINSWTHVAIVRSGLGANNLKMYINGVQVAQSSNASSFTYTGTQPVGANASGNGSLFPSNVYISNFRIVNGTAVYTGNFTPPTSPLTAITNTALLLNFTNAGIYDAAAQNVITTVGNAQVSIAQSKFPPSSILFDGTGDWLLMPNNPAFAFGTGDFTLECWVYFTSVSGAPTITDSRSSTSSTAGFNLGLSSARVQLYTTSQLLIGATTLVINQWYYIAVTRVGAALKIFVDGSQDATTSNSTNFSDQTLVIGATPNLVNPMTGYIQDLRLTKGVGRTITPPPPTAPFPTR